MKGKYWIPVNSGLFKCFHNGGCLHASMLLPGKDPLFVIQVFQASVTDFLCNSLGA